MAHRRKRIRNWVKLLIVGIIFMMVLATPYGRMIFRFLLPVGSGVDDIVEAIVFIGIIIVLIYKAKKNDFSFTEWLSDNDNDPDNDYDWMDTDDNK